MIRAFASLSVMLLVSACATPSADHVGYWDGCESAFDDHLRTPYLGTYHKDADLYADNAEYRSAWDRGYRACVERERNAPWIRRM